MILSHIITFFIILSMALTYGCTTAHEPLSDQETALVNQDGIGLLTVRVKKGYKLQYGKATVQIVIRNRATNGEELLSVPPSVTDGATLSYRLPAGSYFVMDAIVNISSGMVDRKLYGSSEFRLKNQSPLVLVEVRGHDQSLLGQVDLVINQTHPDTDHFVNEGSVKFTPAN